MNNIPPYPVAEADFAVARASVQRKLHHQPHWLYNEQAVREWRSAQAEWLIRRHQPNTPTR